MTAANCWHCRQFVQMVYPDEEVNGTFNFGGQHVPIFPDYRFSQESDNALQLAIFSCVNCGYPNIAEIQPSAPSIEGCPPEDRIIRWLPVEPLGKKYPTSVPSDIASIANEAHRCAEIGANRAAVAIARSALEGIVSDQEKTPSKKKLYERITDLSRSGIITARTAKAATAIRLCGNDSVHNVSAPVDAEYAEIIIQILDSIIDDLYSHPLLVDRAKQYADQKRAMQKEDTHDSDK